MNGRNNYMGRFQGMGQAPQGEPSLGELAQIFDNRMAMVEGALADLGRLKVAEDVTEDWLQNPYRFVSMAAGTTAVITRTVSGDGPFDLIEITYRAKNTDDTTPSNSNFRFRIKEGEAVGRTLTQDGEFVDAENSGGTGQRPYIIKGRRRYRANIAIQVEVTNTDALANTIEIVLHGIKVFTR